VILNKTALDNCYCSFSIPPEVPQYLQGNIGVTHEMNESYQLIVKRVRSILSVSIGAKNQNSRNAYISSH
jgi:hypothetical protein